MKQIIILDKLEGGNRFRFALWAAVPTTRQSYYADANKKSVWLGASVTENADIAAGRVVERVDVISVAPAWTVGQIQAELQGAWSQFQNDITGRNPWARYGATWDGSTWTAGGVA